ncbi:DegV family protein [Anaerofustis stercorihominis]|uniref:DegV family protein n=1 Tax=Anaerofustis stercorihominis TaxID=214853 RepID=UPI00214C6C8A|nr:DegV family protein [Anaerofustis stercorihominis]MCR2033660.1 DegV family protein [Anaerofustis stercorihominis]
MNINEKIAIITDSGTDVPKKYVDKYNMYVVPLIVNYNNKSYKDVVDIDIDTICDRLKEEIPTTSLPSIDDIMETFEKVISDGYDKAIVITISSGLSGTYNAMRIASESFEGRLETMLIDTKNIDIGAGFSAIRAGELIEQGCSFDEIKEKLDDAIKNTKVYFCVKTLEYLRKGGRIGLVASVVGTALDLKPVMSCNEDGVYYVVSKARGRKKSLKKALSEAIDYSKKYNKYNVAVVNVQAEDEAKEIENSIKKEFPNVENVFVGSISPTLAVHTGPGLIGVGVQKID